MLLFLDLAITNYMEQKSNPVRNFNYGKNFS